MLSYLGFRLPGPGSLQRAPGSIWNFGSLLKSHSILSKFGPPPTPTPASCPALLFFFPKSSVRSGDGGFISVMSAIQQASETGGLKNIFPVVHLCYIKPIQISLRGAGGITTPQSQCMRSFAFASSLPSGAAGPVRGPWNSEQRRQPWKWMMP